MPGQVPKRHEMVLACVDEANPRNGKAAILRLQDGRLLLAWTRFSGGGE
jgi:hypothetical protein